MNLGAVDHFFETLASRAQWQGCPTPGADRRPRSPQPPPVAASAKGASSRFLRCGRSRVAQHRRGAEQDAGSAEEIEQADWESSCDRRSTYAHCGPWDDQRADRSARSGADSRSSPSCRGSKGPARDRKRVVSGKSVTVRVDRGGGRIIKKKT